MSVMDASLTQSHEVIAVGLETIIGGYTDPAGFADLANVTYCHGINNLMAALNHVIPSPPCLDYRLFEGFACIPRLSLSSGCSFRCAFCTVPTKLVTATEERLLADVDALSVLSYELIFVDDKSFGQASNWRLLAKVRDMICDRSNELYGFIVQTPPSIAARPGFLEVCYELGVRYVEFGVETVDDALLKWLQKPFSVKHLHRACSIARDLGMYIIPNLIIGIPGDTYSGSIAWLEDNVDIIPVVNVNWLSVHHGNDHGSLDLPDNGIADRDQNASSKTWLSPTEEARGHLAITQCYDITDSYWQGRSVDLQPLTMAHA
jgi:Radical SAM superfamily